MNTLDTNDAGLKEFVRRRGLSIDTLRHKGRLTLTVDGQYRVHLRPDCDGRLVLNARIVTLPGRSDSVESEQWLARKMNAAAGLLREFTSTLCTEPRHGDLLLQQSLPAGLSGEQLEGEVAEFVNALQFWTKTGQNL